MRRILCIGEALIDMICTDKGLPLSAGVQFVKKAGGAPTNVAAAIAALGGSVDIAAKVGADPFGQHIEDILRDFGVGTELLLHDPDHFTTFAFVSLMENGERDFYFNRGADAQLSIADLASIPDSRYGIAHFGSATAFLPGPLQEAYLHVLGQAGQWGCFISFDPNYRHLLYHDKQEAFRGQSLHFLKACHFCKLSEEEALLLSGATDLHSAVDTLRRSSAAVMAITLGSRGTLLSFSDQHVIVPSIPVKPVDTTGAGDAFAGAVLFQLAALPECRLQELGFDAWQQIVAQANKAGARTCEYLGAMEAFRHLQGQMFTKD